MTPSSLSPDLVSASHVTLSNDLVTFKDAANACQHRGLAKLTERNKAEAIQRLKDKNLTTAWVADYLHGTLFHKCTVFHSFEDLKSNLENFANSGSPSVTEILNKLPMNIQSCDKHCLQIANGKITDEYCGINQSHLCIGNRSKLTFESTFSITSSALIYRHTGMFTEMFRKFIRKMVRGYTNYSRPIAVSISTLHVD